MHAALSYLQQLGGDAAPAVPRLIKILEPDKDINVRVQTANTLGSIGPKAQLALPTLNKLSETSDGSLKISVDTAIRRINVNGQGPANSENFVGGSVL
jgi:HEAT repeat protein